MHTLELVFVDFRIVEVDHIDRTKRIEVVGTPCTIRLVEGVKTSFEVIDNTVVGVKPALVGMLVAVPLELAAYVAIVVVAARIAAVGEIAVVAVVAHTIAAGLTYIRSVTSVDCNPFVNHC